MTVEELINQLALLDPDMAVYVRGYHGNDLDPAGSVSVVSHWEHDEAVVRISCDG